MDEWAVYHIDHRRRRQTDHFLEAPELNKCSCTTISWWRLRVPVQHTGLYWPSILLSTWPSYILNWDSLKVLEKCSNTEQVEVKDAVNLSEPNRKVTHSPVTLYHSAFWEKISNCSLMHEKSEVSTPCFYFLFFLSFYTCFVRLLFKISSDASVVLCSFWS